MAFIFFISTLTFVVLNLCTAYISEAKYTMDNGIREWQISEICGQMKNGKTLNSPQ